MSANLGLHGLPDDCWLQVLQYLVPHDFLNLASTGLSFRKRLAEESLLISSFVTQSWGAECHAALEKYALEELSKTSDQQIYRSSMVAPCSIYTSLCHMPHGIFAEYLVGHHVRATARMQFVDRALFLSSKSLDHEAKLMMKEIMTRVRRNIDRLLVVLRRNSYPNRTEKDQNQMHTPPEKLGDIDLKIANMNRILHPAKIPLSLEYFWKYVGEVVFAPYNTGNDEYLQFWGSYISSWSSDPENIVPDSLWICGPGTIENDLEYMVNECRDEGTDDPYPVSLSLAPSHDSKAHVSGEGPVGMFIWLDEELPLFDALYDQPIKMLPIYSYLIKHTYQLRKFYGVPFVDKKYDSSQHYNFVPQPEPEAGEDSGPLACLHAQDKYAMLGVRSAHNFWMLGTFIDALRYIILENYGFPTLRDYWDDLSEERKNLWFELASCITPF